MTIANVALTDSFDLWRTRFNQVVYAINPLTESNAYSTGTLTIANPGFYNSNVSLNVSNGVISVKGNTFDSNSIIFTSNSATLKVSGTGALGTILYFDIGNLSTSVSDNSSSNIASANSVYTTYIQTGLSYSQANAAYSQANLVFVQANAAYSQANLVFDQANTAYNQANLVFGQANTAYNQANSAYNQANNALANTSGVTIAGSLYIPSGSNLGVGTSSPAANLDVVGSATFAKANVLSQILTDGATVSWDTSLGQIATITLGGSRTMAAPTNLRVGTYILHVIQDGTGSRTLSWNLMYRFPGNVAPTLTTTANAHDVMTFVSDGTYLYGTYINNV